MACFIPFNDKDLDVSMFVFKPTIVLVDDFVEKLRCFSLSTESLGCVQSSILKSIHGNLIIWYGGWTKTSIEGKELLTSNLLSMLMNISNMAILVEHNFFEPYGGESRSGSSVAQFYNGDIISINTSIPTSKSSELNPFSHIFLAMFRSDFAKNEGVSAGVCLRGSVDMPRVACVRVWKSLNSCYSWILSSDCRKKMVPCVDGSVKYDVFKVVFVSSEFLPKCDDNNKVGFVQYGTMFEFGVVCEKRSLGCNKSVYFGPRYGLRQIN